MSKEIKNLLKLALEKDASSFKDNMNDVISSRIQAQLDVRKDEISADIIVKTEESVELDEASYTFKNSGEASKFMKAVTQAGIDKKILKSKGNSVTVGKLKDKDMQQMLDLMAKDMKATIKAGMSY
tara:strand:+ start:233 stop:610 length:378 start_codon:yes stop_codon:yes gene_type:complete